jgi:hypothetical protein
MRQCSRTIAPLAALLLAAVPPLAGCAAGPGADPAPTPVVARHPLQGIPRGTPDDTVTALVMRRDSLDFELHGLAQEVRELDRTISEYARTPGGDRTPNLGTNSATGRGAVADRFRDGVRNEMSIWRLAEQAKRLQQVMRVRIEEREGVCSELGMRLGPIDGRRCAAL